jgi:type IV pilus assembly protein PilC
VIRLADERGRVQEQTHSAATAEELRTRFTQAGYFVYSVKARNVLAGSSKKKVKLETFLIFNQQFLTLIRAGLPILGSGVRRGGRRSPTSRRSWRTWRRA